MQIVRDRDWIHQIRAGEKELVLGLTKVVMEWQLVKKLNEDGYACYHQSENRKGQNRIINVVAVSITEALEILNFR